MWSGGIACTMSVGTGLWPHLGADLPRISPIEDLVKGDTIY